MGYPVRYRTQAARNAGGSSQGPRVKPAGQVLQFPERRMQGFQTGLSEAAKKRRKKESQQSKKRRPAVKAPRPTNRGLAPWTRPNNPFGLRNPLGTAQRTANRRALFGAFKGGLKLRRALLGAVALWVIHRLWDAAMDRMRSRNPGMAKHPLWTVSGQWGRYPYCSGKTSAHTNGQYVGHNSPPLVFGHAWGGPPFDWAEYDKVDDIENPITHVHTWWFTQVGRGDQGTGPSPSTFYNSLKDMPGLVPGQLENPWGQPYNPSWNRLPGRWPTELPVNLPDLPMFDPFLPPGRYENSAPMPVPYAMLPYRQPNPWRSPSEQSQWGPRTVRVPTTAPKPITWPDIFPDPDIFGQPEPWVDPSPWQPPTVERPPQDRITFRPNRPPRRGPHFRRDAKPRARVKEKKIKGVAIAAKFLMVIVNGITETSDFVRALHKALPKKYQRRGKLVMDQWKDVYKHWDELDILHALRAIARDQLEDYLYGKIGSLSGKAANKRGQLYDPLSRANRKLSSADYEAGVKHDPIKLFLDQIFGEDT